MNIFDIRKKEDIRIDVSQLHLYIVRNGTILFQNSITIQDYTISQKIS